MFDNTMSDDSLDPDMNHDELIKKWQDCDFDNIIPKIFITNIEKSNSFSSIQKDRMKAIPYLLWVLSTLYPYDYISKSKVVYNSPMPPLCGPQDPDGTVENALKIVEKQYFDVIYLLHCGVYRPIKTTLRHILEQTVLIVNSLTNKGDFTNNEDDRDKAMSYNQFKSRSKYAARTYKKIKEDKNNDDNGWKLRQKNFNKIEKYVRYIEFGDKKNIDALNYIYDELSVWAHGNLWEEISYRDEHIHDLKQIPFYISNPNESDCIDSLKLILSTYQIILYLLLVASYIDIGYYNKTKAQNFFDRIKTEVEYCPGVKFPAIKKLLDDPPCEQDRELCVGTSINCSECGKPIIDDYYCTACDTIQMIDCPQCELSHILGTECGDCDTLNNR